VIYAATNPLQTGLGFCFNAVKGTVRHSLTTRGNNKRKPVS
jgi:hypothetical protein